MATVTTFLESGTDATQGLEFYASTTTSGTGAIASDSSRSRTGPRSIKFTQGVGVGASRANTGGAVFLDTGSQTSFALNFDTLPGAASQVFVVRDSATLIVLAASVNAAGTMRAAPQGGTAVNGTAVLSVNTWYRIAVSWYITNTTTYAMVIYVHDTNNVLLDTITANAGTLTRVGSDRASYGLVTGSWANSSNVWIDDIYCSTGGASSSAQPDTIDIHVTNKRPFSNGTTNGFTGTGTPSGYGSGNAQYVNEQPLNVANFVSVVAAGVTTEEYNVEAATVGDVNVGGTTILDIAGWLYAKALLSETASMVLNGATSNVSLTSTTTLFENYASATPYPAGTGTDIGLTTTALATTVTLYECGVLIAYTPGSRTRLLLLGVG